MLSLLLGINRWASAKVDHVLALVLIRDKDWHLLLCGCGAFNELDD